MFVKSKNRKPENRYKFDIGRKRKMWQKLVTATISALLILVPLSNGLYFHIAETERKCFIEEIPDETMVTGTKKYLKNILSKSLIIEILKSYLEDFQFTFL